MDIERFCGTNDFRQYLHRPLRTDRGLIATDGAIAVLVQDDGGEYDNFADHVNGTTVEKLFDGHAAAREWMLACALPCPGKKKCQHCDGAGHTLMEDCDECDGDGDFHHGSWVYECKECDGAGRVKRPNGSHKEPCYQCKSTGLEVVSVPVGGVTHISSKYVALLKELPDCEISPAPQPSPIPFRFQGGIGVVMPIRPS